MSRLDDIVDKMAWDDRESERKHTMLDGLSEPADTPANKDAQYDEADENIIKANFITLEEDDNVVESFNQVSEDTVMPEQTHHAPAPRRTIVPTNVNTEPPAKKPSFWNKVVGNVKEFFAPVDEDKAAGVPAHLVREKVLKMERQREDHIIALCYETFAYIDEKRSGKITKDQAWVYVCEMSKFARDIQGEQFDVDEWLAIRDDFQDQLLHYDRYSITMEQFVRTLAQINIDDEMLQT